MAFKQINGGRSLHAREQALLRTRQKLKLASEQDRTLFGAELDVIEMEWKAQVPAYFFGSLVVLLWSEIEALRERFADEVKTEMGSSLAYADIAGSSPYSRLRKYLEATLHARLPENSRLEDLYFLRNLYAHRGGDTTGETESRTKRIRAIQSADDAGFTDTYLVVGPQYIERSDEEARSVMRQLRNLHPSDEPSLVEIEG